MARDVSAPGGAAPNPYFDTLYKLIPAEITAAFLAITSTQNLDRGLEGDVGYLVIVAGSFVVLLLLVPFYTAKVQGVRSLPQIAVSTLSFPIWAAGISAPYLSYLVGFQTGPVSGAALILWTMIVPLFLKRSGGGEPPVAGGGA